MVGVAVHVVNEVAELLVLGGSFQFDAAAEVGSHLRHLCEDVRHSKAHAADGVVGLPPLLQSRVASPLRFPSRERKFS